MRKNDISNQIFEDYKRFHFTLVESFVGKRNSLYIYIYNYSLLNIPRECEYVSSFLFLDL